MRAVVATKLSADDPVSGVGFADVPEPVAGPGQVAVTVRAASLNHHDLWSLRGVGVTEDRLPMVLGSDVSGVTADGREVVVHSLIADPSTGDELLDPRRDTLAGGLASTVVVPARNVVDKPASLTFAQAACLPTAWLTAYHMLFDRGAARPGQSVLIQGAGGGVATAALTLAVAAGLRVWVTSRDASKLEKAAALGADGGFASGARLPSRVDLVLDTVGGATWDHSLRSVKPGGRVVVAGATAGAVATTDLFKLFLQQITVCGSAMGRRSELVDLLALCDARGLRPAIDSEFSLADAPAAFARLASGAAFGKVVVVP